MASLSNSGHGGNVHGAARRLQRPIERLVDFSASINPLGPSPLVRRALEKTRGLLTYYPDPDCYYLRSILGRRWALSSDHIVMGNGSIELIDLLPRALAIRHALIVGPTFSEYARAMSRSGGCSTMLYAKRSMAYRPPLDELILRIRTEKRKAPSSVDAVVLCNPNSPTGQVCDPDEVLVVTREAQRAGLWMIVDETFIDYCESRSIVSYLPNYQRLIVLRSFTKFYALPGLRIGYLAASSRVARRVRSAQPPWSVNSMALAAAEASLRDRSHAKRSLRFMERQRRDFALRLSELLRLVVFPSSANFLLIELPQPYRADHISKTLEQRGLLIRDCSTVRGLGSRIIRVAIRSKKENDRLILELKRLLK